MQPGGPLVCISYPIQDEIAGWIKGNVVDPTGTLSPDFSQIRCHQIVSEGYRWIAFTRGDLSQNSSFPVYDYENQAWYWISYSQAPECMDTVYFDNSKPFQIFAWNGRVYRHLDFLYTTAREGFKSILSFFPVDGGSMRDFKQPVSIRLYTNHPYTSGLFTGTLFADQTSYQLSFVPQMDPVRIPGQSNETVAWLATSGAVVYGLRLTLSLTWPNNTTADFRLYRVDMDVKDMEVVSGEP